MFFPSGDSRLALAGASLAVLVTACSSAMPQALVSDQKPSATETIVTAIVAEVPKLQHKTVAVIEFSELLGTAYVPSPKGKFIAERITTQLVSSGKVEVAERTYLEKVIGELKFGVSGMVDDAKAKSIGKLLGVEAIVTGTLTGVGDETEIHSRMVRVEDGKILAAVTTRDVIHLDLPPPNAVSQRRQPLAFSPNASIAPVSPATALAPKAEVPKGSRAIIKTKFGDIELKFYSDLAPKHVENFIALANSGFYNGTIFHRVIPGFMIQGGDPNTKDLNKPETYGQGGPSQRLKAEFNDIPHKRGILSMARTRDPNSAGSQFFIVVKDSNFLDGQYTVFGEVVKGMEAVDKIVSLPKNSRDLPTERVEMTVVVVE